MGPLFLSSFVRQITGQGQGSSGSARPAGSAYRGNAEAASPAAAKRATATFDDLTRVKWRRHRLPLDTGWARRMHFLAPITITRGLRIALSR